MASKYRSLLSSSDGNSSRSRAWTSPMLSRPVVGATSVIDRPLLERSPAGPRLPGAEHEAALADLDLVASLQDHVVDPFAVDVGAVQAADVVDPEAVRPTAELGMTSRHRHVVEEDLAVGVPPGAHDVGVEQEPAARAGAALDHEERAARRQGVDGRGVGGVERPLLR